MNESTILELRKEIEKLESELKSRREQILDINQWSAILLQNRRSIRDRVLWSAISDINNRTTD